MSYAHKTEVPTARSREEIERTLKRYGATNFYYGSEMVRTIIGFRIDSRLIRLIVPIPSEQEILRSYKRTPTNKQIEACINQEIRRRWRALALIVKAKLEAVESGISTIEQEFLASIMLGDGKTVYDHLEPRLIESYAKGRPVALLEASI